MSDTGLNRTEEAHIQQAADEAFRVLTGNEEPAPRPLRVSRILCNLTREAPLQALTIAFLLGVMVARRR
jgi:hypothetical protein